MSKLDQKIKEINAQILKLAKRKSTLLAIKASASSGTKGGEGSGRYPAGSAGAESIPKTPPPTNPVTAKSDGVKGGISSTSHEIMDVIIPKGNFGGEAEKVDIEVQDDNGKSTMLSVTVLAESSRNSTGLGGADGPLERDPVRVDSIKDPDGNEVAASDAMIASIESHIDSAIETQDYRNRED